MSGAGFGWSGRWAFGWETWEDNDREAAVWLVLYKCEGNLSITREVTSSRGWNNGPSIQQQVQEAEQWPSENVNAEHLAAHSARKGVDPPILFNNCYTFLVSVMSTHLHLQSRLMSLVVK